jgi:hypothetical protein
MEAIHSFDKSRQHRCGNRNSGGTADCCKTAISGQSLPIFEGV